ncbi:hypothetical protein TIFTF001_026884 [Ficus carica]|uniref:Uncharacterized protein n=1 Tax=Ficus carica TaxID=3494 RepID=A0AA88DM10_FICCA|nr:hypothetical protein TIFTF001_026884 [Ficus carica]
MAGCYGGRVEQEFLLMQGLEPLFQSFRVYIKFPHRIFKIVQGTGNFLHTCIPEYDNLLSCLDGMIDQERMTISPTTPWLCTTVSNLPAMLDARLWRDDTADYEIWRLNSVVTTRRCANNKLDVTNNNLVDYDDGYESDDEIDDMIL